jgi:hypothetical protein
MDKNSVEELRVASLVALRKAMSNALDEMMMEVMTGKIKPETRMQGADYFEGHGWSLSGRRYVSPRSNGFVYTVRQDGFSYLVTVESVGTSGMSAWGDELGRYDTASGAMRGVKEHAEKQLHASIEMIKSNSYIPKIEE